jgi:hypothetical protein
VDFGYTNPFVLQCWAEDPDGRLYLYREIYKTRTLVEDHAKRILREVTKCVTCCKTRNPGTHDCWACDDCVKEWTEPKPRASSATTTPRTGRPWSGTSACRPSRRTSSVKPGLEAVQTRMKPAGDGRPRIFLLADSLLERDEALADAKKPACTEEEIPGYVWDPGTAAARAAEKPPKEQPLKENDHGCDAKRYVVAERDLGGRPRIRWMS